MGVGCGDCREIARGIVIDAITHPAASRVNFSFGALQVTPGSLGRITQMILDRKIDTVAGNLPPGWEAAYVAKRNLLVLTSNSSEHDEVGYPTRVSEAEALAYLGQTVYAIAYAAISTGQSPEAIAAGAMSSEPLFSTSARVAQRLGMLTGGHVVVLPQHIAEIEQAVVLKTMYRDVALKHLEWDGIR